MKAKTPQQILKEAQDLTVQANKEAATFEVTQGAENLKALDAILARILKSDGRATASAWDELHGLLIKTLGTVSEARQLRMTFEAYHGMAEALKPLAEAPQVNEPDQMSLDEAPEVPNGVIGAPLFARDGSLKGYRYEYHGEVIRKVARTRYDKVSHYEKDGVHRWAFGAWKDHRLVAAYGEPTIHSITWTNILQATN